MRNPLLIVRFVLFSILVYLSVLALGFAGWEIASINEMGLPMAGSPIFAMFNACAFLFFIALACAELVIPDAKTGAIYFECLWTGTMSALSLSSAIDVIVNGPPVYCRVQDYEAICTSSTVLAAITWTTSFITIAYFLTLFYLALSHASVYGAFWQLTVYHAPWFVEPTLPLAHSGPTSKPPRPPQHKATEPWENPAFRHDDDEQDIGDAPLPPPLAPWARDPEAHALPARRTAPSPVQSTASLRPPWAQRVQTRRGVDPPFAPAPAASRLSRLVRSFWSASSAPPPSPPPPVPPKFAPRPLALRTSPSPLPAFVDSPLPEGGFVDCFRGSYGYFPEAVVDEDSPIEQPRRSEWVRALRR
ncbi:hypothetical protein PsYK624_113850 [Phanerochaete sordida]|uniref:MARVEL domain-containing protein n=1 Tax=Phanerochaete sordida TaxID=48140 RepID=A0A9P3GJ54_9APHY|nr:hypothetical protein PsYK624_113850 [Phanerochaete sordida]